jgi:signal transduction histidine kinase
LPALLGGLNLVLLAVGFLALIGTVGASVVLTARNRDAFDLATKTEAAMSDVARSLELLEDAETGQRGFLLTERQAYLTPYQNAAVHIPGQLDRLVAESASMPIAAMTVQLRANGLAKLAEVTKTLDLYKSDGRDAALALVETDRGKALMDLVRADAAKLRNVQEAELASRLTIARRTARILVAAQAGTASLVGVIAILTVIGLYRNVSALRQAQAALRDTNANLEQIVNLRTQALSQANEEIQKFAYIVSHDLRAPLVNIMGFTNELEAAAKTVGQYLAGRIKAEDNDVPQAVVEAIGQDVPEAFNFIKTSTAKMDRLIGAILKLSREGRRVLTPEPLAMRPLLENIVATLKHRADEKGAEIIIQPLPNIVSDRLGIEQIFGNLLDNCIKYLAPDRPGVVTVRGTARPPFAIFEVEDNGRGIAPQDRDRVFDLFRRAGQQNVPGEGIGLAFVRQFVHRLGGTIEIESELAKGTIFRLSLPIDGVRS